MAKRAALVDLKTSEELDKFLDVKCLVVLNVYSGYFGPCNALATNLRDFKMVSGGDDLQVASVNVDNIDVFKRFRKKSEPAYLMIMNHKIVNSFFGCNVTALLKLIKEEIDIYKSGEDIKRPMADLNEMSELEAQRFRAMREELITVRRLDQAKKHQIVHDYRMHITDNIMENVADVGVTVFMPHVMEDKLLDKVVEPAQAQNMTVKQSIITQISRTDLEMINFDHENLQPMVFNHIRDRDLLIVAWKMGSGELRPINEIFEEFAKALSADLPFESGGDQKGKKGKKKGKKKEEAPPPPPPEEKPEGAEGVEGEGEYEGPPIIKLPAISVPLSTLSTKKLDPIQIEPIDLQFIDNEKDIIKLICESITAFTNQRIVTMHNECIKGELVNLIDRMDQEDEEEAAEAEKDGKKKPEDEQKEVKKKKKGKPAAKPKTRFGNIALDPKRADMAYVCPIWTPPTPRAHAAFLYVYFRKILSFFLPLDPPGADRFVIVVFSITRHEEILDFMKDNPKLLREGVLAHGFFRGFVDGEDYANTVLLCKTGLEYRLRTDPEPGDKLILKVVANSEALLALVEIKPDFVSQNDHDGRLECDVIFPLGYTSISEEEMEAEMEMDEEFGAAVEGEGLEEGSEAATEATTEAGSVKDESVKDDEIIKDVESIKDESIKDNTVEDAESVKDENFKQDESVKEEVIRDENVRDETTKEDNP